ncbi:MAG: NUDIX domain-containing protein [Candidatus Paceibacterota bacterium]|jgi:isopentenyldiphosphate isomerase
MDARILNIVDEAGNVIGQTTRQEIHEKGLLHAEVHVWFYTPDGQLIFQHRAKDKDTWPDLLDATVGGHVEVGDTYEQTALKEAEEEAGVHIKPNDLFFLRTTITNSHDDVTGMTNHPRRNVYAYCYRGKLEDLKIEEGKALGFEAWPIDKLLNISKEGATKFIPSILDGTGIEIIKQIKDLI